jgi:hypothetical protein
MAAPVRRTVKGMGAGQDPRGDARSQWSRREEACARLPVTYALALRLRDEGLPEDLLAERLGVEPEALGPLLEIAEAKLAAILADDTEQ